MIMTIKPAEVDISLHKIYSEDAFELDSILFEPKKKTNKIIIHIHGKEGNFVQNHFVTVMGYKYPLEGYSFLTFNNRGHDYMADLLKRSSNGFEWIQGGAAFDLIEDSSKDINGVIEYVANLGYGTIILQGHSLGPHKIAYYLANRPKYLISKAIFISPGDIIYLLNTFVNDWKKYVNVAKKLVDDNKENMIMPIRIWSNAPVSAKTYWDYTNPNSNAWIFNFTSPNQEFKHFNKLTLPILVIQPENDFANGASHKQIVKMLYESSISKKISVKVIYDAVHNFASKEKELSRVILDWLKSKK